MLENSFYLAKSQYKNKKKNWMEENVDEKRKNEFVDVIKRENIGPLSMLQNQRDNLKQRVQLVLHKNSELLSNFPSDKDLKPCRITESLISFGDILYNFYLIFRLNCLLNNCNI